MPAGNGTSILGRQIITSMGTTQLRNVHLTFPAAAGLFQKRYGELIISEVAPNGDVSALEVKPLYVPGSGWKFLANHMIVRTNHTFRLSAVWYEGGVPFSWFYA